jgi:hypothetical protein
MAAKKKKRSISTALRNYTHPAYGPYVAALGQLALSWNGLHESLSAIFAALLWHEAPGRADALWNSSNLDRPKREMLKAAVVTCPQDDLRRWPTLKDDLLWVMHQTDVLEDARNTAIHSPLFCQITLTPPDGLTVVVTPGVHRQNPRALRLAKKDLLTEFRWCRDSCMTLSHYVGGIMAVVVWYREYGDNPIILPWPKRPSLPNRGQKKTRRTQQYRIHLE